MAATPSQSAALYSTLVDLMGQEDAETLIERLPSVAWHQLATKDDLETTAALLQAALTAGLAEANARITETNAALTAGLAETNAALTAGLAETNAALTAGLAETNSAMQAGFARMERRLAWYLVSAAALMVGFAIAIWFPLVGALRQQSPASPPGPASAVTAPPEPAADVLAPPGPASAVTAPALPSAPP